MIQTGILTPTGLISTPYPAENFMQATQQEPEGVYTITRTFQRTSALLLDSHLSRLEESARLEGIDLHLDRAALRAAIRTLIDRGGHPESRFRITVPRHQPDQIYLALEALQPVPAAIRQHGAKVITLHENRQNPAAKTTAWMNQRQEAMKQAGKDIYEGILVDENGYLLEGSSSNFYAILNGELYTADEGILHGIARRAVFESLGDLLPLQLKPIHITQLPQISEAFLTSSGRGVVSIIQIDDQLIGDGTPQTMTRELENRYNQWTEAHLEPI